MHNSPMPSDSKLINPPPLQNFCFFIKPFEITFLTQYNSSMIKQTGIYMLSPLLLNILLLKIRASSLFWLLIDCRLPGTP